MSEVEGYVQCANCGDMVPFGDGDLLEHSELAARIAQLEAALWDQWERNHSEHCTNDWPHPGKTCYYPLIAALDQKAPA